MKSPLIGTVIIVIVVILLVVVFLHPNVLSIGKTTSQSLSMQTNISGLLAESQNLYNSAGPFNLSYSFKIFNASSNMFENGTFSLAKFNNDFRFSASIRSPVLPQVVYVVDYVGFYNGANLYKCYQFKFENTTPVNSTIISEINAINANSKLNCTSIAVPSNITSFDMADMFNLMPFSLIEVSSSNGLKYISPSLSFENASVSQIGSRMYLGIKCYLESITPPVNQNSNNVTIDECISASTGLPLTVTA
ncbi:MAG: hypothetical protein ACP5M8_07530, partial [Caldisphaera sp.]